MPEMSHKLPWAEFWVNFCEICGKVPLRRFSQFLQFSLDHSTVAPLRSAIALIRQYIIAFLVFKSGASVVTQHLAGCGASLSKLLAIMLTL
jgi:hypothetical protein